jgi:hypothetical protein
VGSDVIGRKEFVKHVGRLDGLWPIRTMEKDGIDVRYQPKSRKRVKKF